MAYHTLNIRIKTMKGYHAPGEKVDLTAEGCNFEAVRRWEAQGSITACDAPKAEKVKALTVEPRQLAEHSDKPKGVPPKVAIWNLDPEALKDKSLAALNVMIAERNPDREPFETEEEAISQLSMEFVKVRGRAI